MSDQPTAPKPKLAAFAAMTLRTARGLPYKDTTEGRAQLVSDAVGAPSRDAGVVRHVRSGSDPLEWSTEGHEIQILLSNLTMPRVVLDLLGQREIAESVDFAQAAMVLARSQNVDATKGCEWTLELLARTNGRFLWRFATADMAQTLCFDGPSIEDALALIDATRERQAFDSVADPGRPGDRRDIDGRRGGTDVK